MKTIMIWSTFFIYSLFFLFLLSLQKETMEYNEELAENHHLTVL